MSRSSLCRGKLSVKEERKRPRKRRMGEKKKGAGSKKKLFCEGNRIKVIGPNN
jgi:hypothetical protein